MITTMTIMINRLKKHLNDPATNLPLLLQPLQPLLEPLRLPKQCLVGQLKPENNKKQMQQIKKIILKLILRLPKQCLIRQLKPVFALLKCVNMHHYK